MSCHVIGEYEPDYLPDDATLTERQGGSASDWPVRGEFFKTGKGRHWSQPNRPDPFEPIKFSGAGEGIRTLDPDLGKVVLYP